MVTGVETGERHGEVEPQSQVGEVERVGRGSEILRREATLQDAESKFFVVAAEPRVQPSTFLHHRRFDLVESVRAIRVADDGEHAFTARLLVGEKVAHTARGVYLACHPSILAPPRARAGWSAPRSRHPGQR